MSIASSLRAASTARGRVDLRAAQPGDLWKAWRGLSSASRWPPAAPALREGEDSDRFYLIESGLVEVTQNGVVLRREGPGEFFGEIGLLRDVPRTATVTAVEDTVLLALGRADFLAAVTGQRDAYLAADDIVTRRLSV